MCSSDLSAANCHPNSAPSARREMKSACKRLKSCWRHCNRVRHLRIGLWGGRCGFEGVQGRRRFVLPCGAACVCLVLIAAFAPSSCSESRFKAAIGLVLRLPCWRRRDGIRCTVHLPISHDEVFTVRAEVSKHSSCDVDPSIPQGERGKHEPTSGRVNPQCLLP